MAGAGSFEIASCVETTDFQSFLGAAGVINKAVAIVVLSITNLPGFRANCGVVVVAVWGTAVSAADRESVAVVVLAGGTSGRAFGPFAVETAFGAGRAADLGLAGASDWVGFGDNVIDFSITIVVFAVADLAGAFMDRRVFIIAVGRTAMFAADFESVFVLILANGAGLLSTHFPFALKTTNRNFCETERFDALKR